MATVLINGKQYKFNNPSTQKQQSQRSGDLGSFQSGDNPFLYGLAKLQEGLYKSPILQTGGSVIGSVLGGVPGAGAGGGSGEYLSQLLKPGETLQDKGLGALVPSIDETKDIGITGAFSAGGSWVGTLLGKVAGAALKSLGNFIYKGGQNIPQSVGESAFTKGYDIGKESIKRKLKGSPEVVKKILDSLKQKVWNSLDDQVDVTNVKTLNDEILDGLVNPNSSKNFQSKFGIKPTEIDDLLENISKELKAFDREYQGNFTEKALAEINAKANAIVKTSTGKGSTSTSVDVNTWRSIQQGVQEIIDKLPTQTRSALNEYGILADLSVSTLKTGGKAQKGNPIKNIMSLVNVPFRAGTNPAISSYLGSGIYNTGQSLGPIGGATGAGLSPNLYSENKQAKELQPQMTQYFR